MLTLEEGRRLVKIAREAIETFLREGREMDPPTDIPESFLEKRGVFVTLLTYPGHELRGCIGLPYPEKELVRGVIGAALAAAFEDPRFHELEPSELEKIIVEVSVLTEPKKIEVEDPKEYPEKIEIGRDGLIIKYGWHTGLLLPQVPVEQGWNEEEYLSGLCIKAGLPSDAWLEGNVEIYSFQAQVFSEEKPNGEVVERRFG